MANQLTGFCILKTLAFNGLGLNVLNAILMSSTGKTQRLSGVSEIRDLAMTRKSFECILEILQIWV